MNRIPVRCQNLLAYLFASLVAVGCGGGSGIKTIPAAGSVSYKGQPLDYGTVTFSPVDSKASVATIAQINKGRFQTEKGRGLTAGAYKVVVNAQRIPADLNETDKSKPAAKAAPDIVIPEKYTSYKTTDLEFKVAPNDRSVTKDFDLKD